MRQINADTSITYIGHATTLIVSPSNSRIVIDPWVTGNPSCPPGFSTVGSLGALDLILVTHIHNDHVGDLVSLLTLNPNAHVICTPEVNAWLSQKGEFHIDEMNIGGSITPIGASIRISMTLAVHTSSYVEEDGTLVHGGAPVGYVLEMENGFTIYASGDTALFSDMALINALYSPDLAILPIGGHYTMSPRAASMAIRLLGVSYVIPIHYGTFPVLTGTPADLTEYCSDIQGLVILPILPGETVS